MTQAAAHSCAAEAAPIFNLYLKTTCSSSEVSLGPVFCCRAFTAKTDNLASTTANVGKTIEKASFQSMFKVSHSHSQSSPMVGSLALQ